MRLMERPRPARVFDGAFNTQNASGGGIAAGDLYMTCLFPCLRGCRIRPTWHACDGEQGPGAQGAPVREQNHASESGSGERLDGGSAAAALAERREMQGKLPGR